MSPWTAPPKESPAEQAERLIDETENGAPRREITFDGRAFQLIVAFFSFDQDSRRVSGYAHDALGRAVVAALVADGALRREMDRQSIYTEEERVMAPKVTVRLGPITLFVKASSFDPKTAQLMAMDRIALALVDSRGASAKVRKLLDEHDIVIARKT
jgi:hypothetical protein